MSITRASTNATGQQGSDFSQTPGGAAQMSADGRYVVFESGSGDLTGGDTNGRQDIFVKDLSTGAITRVSTAADGTQADGASSGATISADGRYVAFLSDAGNLAPGGTAGQTDAYVKDLRTQAITRVNTAPDGVTPGNDSALNAVISADGSHVVFSSAATNLVANDTNGQQDVFVKNLGTGTLARVSTDAGGAEANDTSGGFGFTDSAAISADGRFVAFSSSATNLVAGDTNGQQDVFLKDVATGAITRVSTAADGTQADGGSLGAAISADGRYVAFTSDATNLVGGDTNAATDVFVKTVANGAITRASTDGNGVEGGAESFGASISADGTRVAFVSNAANLVAGDTNGTPDVFVKDLPSGATVRASTAADGTQTGDGFSYNASISSDGSRVAFTSLSSDLVAGDTNNRPDVFVTDTVCYAGGTRIRTVRGDIAVEDLVVGDLAVTASGEPRPIRWLGQRTIPCQGRADRLPVRIAAHAFGPDRPVRDLRVSPGHALCLDLLGEVLVPAGSLVNGTTLTQDPVERVTYWHVELEEHDILLAENLPAESYCDVGNRAFFAGAPTVDLTLGPDAPSGSGAAAFCRPLHADGPLVDFVRLRLRERAEAAGWALVDAVPGDLHLVADGVTIRPAMDGLTARLVLPADARDVYLVSPTGVPVHVDAASGDRRRLGLVLTGLAVMDPIGGTRDIALDDARLGAGFHPVEGEGAVVWRWTDGAALLPASLWAGCPGPVHLQVTLAGAGVPRWVGPDAAPAPEPANLRHCA